jgi:hypothetical protein
VAPRARPTVTVEPTPLTAPGAANQAIAALRVGATAAFSAQPTAAHRAVAALRARRAGGAAVEDAGAATAIGRPAALAANAVPLAAGLVVTAVGRLAARRLAGTRRATAALAARAPVSALDVLRARLAPTAHAGEVRRAVAGAPAARRGGRRLHAPVVLTPALRAVSGVTALPLDAAAFTAHGAGGTRHRRGTRRAGANRALPVAARLPGATLGARDAGAAAGRAADLPGLAPRAAVERGGGALLSARGQDQGEEPRQGS